MASLPSLLRSASRGEIIILLQKSWGPVLDRTEGTAPGPSSSPSSLCFCPEAGRDRAVGATGAEVWEGSLRIGINHPLPTPPHSSSLLPWKETSKYKRLWKLQDISHGDVAHHVGKRFDRFEVLCKQG